MLIWALFVLLDLTIFGASCYLLRKLAVRFNIIWMPQWLSDFKTFLLRKNGWGVLTILILIGGFVHSFLWSLIISFVAVITSACFFYSSWRKTKDWVRTYSGQVAVQMLEKELLTDNARLELKRLIKQYSSKINDEYCDYCDVIRLFDDDFSVANGSGSAIVHDVRAWLINDDDKTKTYLEKFEEGRKLIDDVQAEVFGIADVFPACGEIRTRFVINGDEYAFFVRFNLRKILKVQFGHETAKDVMWNDVFNLIDSKLGIAVCDDLKNPTPQSLLSVIRERRLNSFANIFLSGNEVALIINGREIVRKLTESTIASKLMSEGILSAEEFYDVAYVKSGLSFSLICNVADFSVMDPVYENVPLEVSGGQVRIECVINHPEVFYKTFGLNRQRIDKGWLVKVLETKVNDSIPLILRTISLERNEEIEQILSNKGVLNDKVTSSLFGYCEEAGLKINELSISGLFIPNDCVGKKNILKLKSARMRDLSAARTSVERRGILGDQCKVEVQEEVVKNLSKSGSESAAQVLSPLVENYLTSDDHRVIYCPKCGAKCKAGENFCSKCGSKLD